MKLTIPYIGEHWRVIVDGKKGGYCNLTISGIFVSPWFGLAAVGCRKLIGFHAWQNASNSWGSEECLVLAKQFESIDLFYFVHASVTMLSQKYKH